jgi:hypothetical protein
MTIPLAQSIRGAVAGRRSAASGHDDDANRRRAVPGRGGRAIRFTIIGCGILALVAAAVSPTSATSSRIRSLGGAGSFFEDDNNVLRWFGSVVDYPNLAVAELGQFDLDARDEPWDERIARQGGGFHVAPDAARRWGVFAVYFESDPLLETTGAIPGGAFTAMWGRSFGHWSPALYFRGTSFNNSTDSSVTQLLGRSEFHHWLGIGLRGDLSDGAYLDLAAEAHNTQFDYADHSRGIASGYSNTWDSWSARGRAFVSLSEKVVLVPLLEHRRDVRPTFSLELDDAADLDARITRVGAGLDVLPDADNLVLITAEYRDLRSELRGRGSPEARFHRQTIDGYSLRGRVGIESRVLAWLTLRFGVEYRRIDEDRYLMHPGGSDYDVWAASHNTYVETPLNLGLGLHFGSFSADVVVNDGAPFGVGYALTGAGQRESATFTSITLSYGF